MTIPSNWPRNRLLLALPAGNLKRLMPALEPIPCQEGQILLDADSSLDDVFFPDSGVVSVVAVYENGNIIEMATIGREGCTGFQAILGDRESSVRFLVQIPGSAAKMSRADRREQWGRCHLSEISCTLTFMPFSNKSWSLVPATVRTA